MKKQNNSQQIKTKYVHRVIETVTGYLTATSSIYISFLAFTIVLSPFLHLFVRFDQKGIFGFPYMTSFLFALALPLVMISSGLLLKFASSVVVAEYSKAFSLLSSVVLFVGLFYLLFTFYPMTKDFSLWIYIAVLLFSSSILFFFCRIIHKAVIYTEEKLKSNIKDLISYVFKHTPLTKDNEKWDLLNKVANGR